MQRKKEKLLDPDTVIAYMKNNTVKDKGDLRREVCQAMEADGKGLAEQLNPQLLLILNALHNLKQPLQAAKGPMPKSMPLPRASCIS